MRRVVVAAVVLLFASVVPPGLARAGNASATFGDFDCNGRSPLQPGIPHVSCPDIGPLTGERFEDNGQYVGHDEPVINFYSTKPGSGYSSRYEITLPTEPSAPANGSFAGPVWSWQLSPAFWFGMDLCDTESYPESTKTCVPRTDANIQVPVRASHAGAAFTELQFYAPDRRGQPSCLTRWCVALTIASVQANFDFSQANFNCIEPQGFAYLTHSGHPIGPTGPDNKDATTYHPTPDVLAMNPGDRVRVSLYDTTDGLNAVVEDLTTGASGSMIASAANGWRHILWDPVNNTCQGAPYTFHAMYSTSSPPAPDGTPKTWAVWTSHTYNVSYDTEVGHFEPPETPRDDDDRFCQNVPVQGCFGTDRDFDGYTYHADWPDGSANFPSPFYLSSPVSRVGTGPWNQTYEQVDFETNLPAVEGSCNIFTGFGCTNPPPGASFYPWVHLASVPSPVVGGPACAWTIANDLPNQISNFGGPKRAWGKLLKIDYGAGFVAYLNFASERMANPCP